MTAPLRKTNGRSTREIARGQPRILGQISVGDPVQNFLALKPPADDRGPCAVTLRLCGFEGIFSAMLQISRFVVSHELDDTRP